MRDRVFLMTNKYMQNFVPDSCMPEDLSLTLLLPFEEAGLSLSWFIFACRCYVAEEDIEKEFRLYVCLYVGCVPSLWRDLDPSRQAPWSCVPRALPLVQRTTQQL